MPPDLIISFVLFVVIGLIVSMDVVGLTLSKTEQFSQGIESPRAWAFINAVWHAFMLAAYVSVINGAIAWSPDLIALFIDASRRLWDALSFLPDSWLSALIATANAFNEHLRIILGVLALTIVWRTYSAKIISRPEHADIKDLPDLARLLFNALDLLNRLFTNKNINPERFTRFLHNHAQAALVAVDMLALAILLKSLGYIEELTHAVMAVGIIFGVVYFTTLAVARKSLAHYSKLNHEIELLRLAKQPSIANQINTTDSRSISTEDIKIEAESAPNNSPMIKSMEWVRITLRLAEPFLIFFFALQLVSLLLLGRQVHGVSMYLGAGILLWSLIDRWKFPAIIQACLTLSPGMASLPDNTRPFKEIASDLSLLLWKYLLLILIIAPLFIISFAIFTAEFTGLHNDGPVVIIAFDTAISNFIAAGIALSPISLAIVYILPRYKLVMSLEEKIKSYTFATIKAISDNRRTFIYMVVSLFIATVFPVVSAMVDNVERGASSHMNIHSMLDENHRHALQVGLWLFMLIILGSIINRCDDRAQEDCKREEIVKGDALVNHDLSMIDAFSHKTVIYPLAMSAVIYFVGLFQAQITN